MKTVAVAEFTRHFRRHRNHPVAVKDRGEVVGHWTPLPKTPKRVGIERLHKIFSSRLPFTGAELLKEGKKR